MLTAEVEMRNKLLHFVSGLALTERTSSFPPPTPSQRIRSDYVRAALTVIPLDFSQGTIALL